MKIFTKMALGPELFWLCVYGAMVLIAQTNIPPTEAGSQSLEKWWYILPFAAVPLTFLAYGLPQTRPWVLLLRINVAAFVGLACASYKVTSAVDYGDSRNSGVPMGWIMSICFGIFTQSAATLIAVPMIVLKQRKISKAHAVDPRVA